MRMTKLLAAVAASSLIAAPALANTAAPLSIAKVANIKTSTSAKKSNKILGLGATTAAIIGAGIVAGAVIIATNDDNNSDSP
ncbi:hypothetical protein [Novosphingobium beihaiensis]|uniref:Uncharacterized protein n=1 Tax=Novosphingobium beihaiensis TaxID=2930389 RepID=A0ABT0BQ88_9SPHN|nr:hypothetical protein [Novosphingobium beihaiensis]MCJ2187222.1 hypothetical protein [Novosphingobium beihaiensis]